MAVQRNRNIAITLLFSLVILLALAPPSSANAVSPDVPHRRDHVNLNRMIKRRVPHALLPRQRTGSQPTNRPQAQAGAVGAAADPSTGGLSSPVPSSTPAASAASASQAPETSQSPQPASSPVSSVVSSATPSVSSASSQSSVGQTSSTTPTSTTSSLTPSTSSPPSTSSTPTPSSQGNKQQLPASKGQSASVDSVTLTSHAPAASSSGSENSKIGASSLSHSAIMILIIIAASIGGCVIIWTIIRKWKFRPSAQFGDRLDPVDWQPAEHDSGLPTHRRGPSNASSFHSAGHDNMLGLSRSDSGGGYNATRNLTPIPDHDFTAGPAAPVGGYADLARGPSPQPPMQEALQRGPSINRAYENYQGGNGVQEAYDFNNAGPRY